MKNLKFISIIVFVVTLIVGGLFISKGNVFATDATLSAQEFTVWIQGGIIGYDAGFSLNGATFNNAKSIDIKLYSGNTLLQTNIATKNTLTGTGFITPFDVFGTFNYKKDGYFTNIKEREYGQNLIPTKVTATVYLADGKIVTATNTSLSGDTNTIGVTPIGQVLGAERFNFRAKMNHGSAGNEVTELQKFLINNGYECGNTDGKFGPKTKSGVMAFQIVNGLEADGIVGPITRAMLNK